jgi:hypothetical protein
MLQALQNHVYTTAEMEPAVAPVPPQADNIRSLILSKEKELHDINEYRIRTLEHLLGERDATCSELNSKITKLKEDFQYNLKLIEGRDAELERYDATFAEVKKVVRDRDVELSEIKIQLADAQAASQQSAAKVLKTDSYYKTKLQELREQLESARWASEEEKHKMTEQFQAAKLELERKAQEREQLLDEQRRQMSESFDELMKRREDEAKLREDSHEVEAMKTATELAELMRQHEALKNSLTKSTKLSDEVRIKLLEEEKRRKKAEWETEEQRNAKDLELASHASANEELKTQNQALLEEYEGKMSDLLQSLHAVERAFIQQREEYEEALEHGSKCKDDAAKHSEDIHEKRIAELTDQLAVAENALETTRQEQKKGQWAHDSEVAQCKREVEATKAEIEAKSAAVDRVISEGRRREGEKEIEWERQRQDLVAELDSHKEQSTGLTADAERLRGEAERVRVELATCQREVVQANLQWQERLQSERDEQQCREREQREQREQREREKQEQGVASEVSLDARLAAMERKHEEELALVRQEKEEADERAVQLEEMARRLRDERTLDFPVVAGVGAVSGGAGGACMDSLSVSVDQTMGRPPPVPGSPLFSDDMGVPSPLASVDTADMMRSMDFMGGQSQASIPLGVGSLGVGSPGVGSLQGSVGLRQSLGRQSLLQQSLQQQQQGQGSTEAANAAAAAASAASAAELEQCKRENEMLREIVKDMRVEMERQVDTTPQSAEQVKQVKQEEQAQEQAQAQERARGAVVEGHKHGGGSEQCKQCEELERELDGLGRYTDLLQRRLADGEGGVGAGESSAGDQEELMLLRERAQVLTTTASRLRRELREARETHRQELQRLEATSQELDLLRAQAEAAHAANELSVASGGEGLQARAMVEKAQLVALEGALEQAKAEVRQLMQERQQLMEISNQQRSELNRAVSESFTKPRLAEEVEKVKQETTKKYELKVKSIEASMHELMEYNRRLKEELRKWQRQPMLAVMNSDSGELQPDGTWTSGGEGGYKVAEEGGARGLASNGYGSEGGCVSGEEGGGDGGGGGGDGGGGHVGDGKEDNTAFENGCSDNDNGGSDNDNGGSDNDNGGSDNDGDPEGINSLRSKLAQAKQSLRLMRANISAAPEEGRQGTRGKAPSIGGYEQISSPFAGSTAAAAARSADELLMGMAEEGGGDVGDGDAADDGGDGDGGDDGEEQGHDEEEGEASTILAGAGASTKLKSSQKAKPKTGAKSSLKSSGKAKAGAKGKPKAVGSKGTVGTLKAVSKLKKSLTKKASGGKGASGKKASSGSGASGLGVSGTKAVAGLKPALLDPKKGGQGKSTPSQKQATARLKVQQQKRAGTKKNVVRNFNEKDD